VRRDVARSNGGYCSACRPRGASPVQGLTDTERLELQEWQALARSRGTEARAEAEARARARIERLRARRAAR
jgi:hypothetical protein